MTAPLNSTDMSVDPLDVPYDQPVPLPICWQTTSQTRRRRPYPPPTRSLLRCWNCSLPWPIILLAIYLCYALVLSNKLPRLSRLYIYDKSPTLHRILYPGLIGSHRLLIRDVEEVKEYVHSLTSNLPAINSSAILAAASTVQTLSRDLTPIAMEFMRCHNTLVAGYETALSEQGDCQSLYKRLSSCNTSLLAYLLTHDRIVGATNELARAMLREISLLQEWEAARSEETRKQMTSPSGLMKDLAQLVLRRTVVAQDPQDRAEGHRRRHEKEFIIEYHDLLKHLQLLSTPTADLTTIQDNYAGATEVFIQRNCDDFNKSCLCSELDLATVGIMLEAVALQVSRLGE